MRWVLSALLVVGLGVIISEQVYIWRIVCAYFFLGMHSKKLYRLLCEDISILCYFNFCPFRVIRPCVNLQFASTRSLDAS